MVFSSNPIKKMIIAGTFLLTSTGIAALPATFAYASPAPFHFQASSFTLQTQAVNNYYSVGQQLTFSLSSDEINADNQNETHPHSLPPKFDVTFTPTSGGAPIDVVATIVKPVQSINDTTGQIATNTYTLTLPQSLNGAFTATIDNGVNSIPFEMWYGGDSQGDSDDPIDTSLVKPITINIGTPPVGKLPEFPVAGLLPVFLLAGYGVYRLTKKSRTV
nr:hypothetical protein [Bacilli bacterium]